MGYCKIITERDENEPFEPYAWCVFHSRTPRECFAALEAEVLNWKGRAQANAIQRDEAERQNRELRNFKTGIENILMPERISPERRLKGIHGLLNNWARAHADTPANGCNRYRAEDGPQFEEWCDTHNAHWAWDARRCQAGAAEPTAEPPGVRTP